MALAGGRLLHEELPDAGRVGLGLARGAHEDGGRGSADLDGLELLAQGRLRGLERRGVVRPLDLEELDLDRPILRRGLARVGLERGHRAAQRAASDRVPEGDRHAGDLARRFDDVVEVLRADRGQAHGFRERAAAVVEGPGARGDEAPRVLDAQGLGGHEGGDDSHGVPDGAVERDSGMGGLVGQPVGDVRGVDDALGVRGAGERFLRGRGEELLEVGAQEGLQALDRRAGGGEPEELEAHARLLDGLPGEDDAGLGAHGKSLPHPRAPGQAQKRREAPK